MIPQIHPIRAARYCLRKIKNRALTQKILYSLYSSLSSIAHLFSANICLLYLSLAICSACAPLQVQYPVHRFTTRIARTNLVGVYRNPVRYCAPDAPTDFPGPRKIVVTDSALLDDLCILGLKNRVIASTEPIPAYLHRIYPHIMHIIPLQADIILQTSALKHNILHPLIPTVNINGKDWKERLYHLAQYLKVEKTAIIALEDYSHYSAQTSTLLDTRDTEVSLVTIHSNSISLLGRAGFPAQILADANVGRPDRINFNLPHNISLETLPLADADLIYITYPPNAISYVKRILNSPQWAQLGAATQNRQFIVNYSWWNEGQGLMAARSILDDLRESLNFSS